MNMMNNILKFCFILAVVGSWLTACSEEQTPSQPGIEPDGIVLSASLSDAHTKTILGALEDGKYPVKWTTGDRISVNGTPSDNAVTEDNQTVVDFTVSGSLTAPYKVLYPETTSANVISLPDTQNYVAGSFDPDAAAAYGNAVKSSGGYSVSLNSFCGLIRFALNGSATLDRIELNSLGSEKLYGSFTLATDGDGFTGVFSGGTTGTLTYSFGSGLTLSGSDTYIYIAIPAQRYASGIEALVYQTDGAFMRLKFWGSGYTLESTKVIAMQSKTYAAGRTENLFAAGSLTAESGTASATIINVGVYNLYAQSSRNKDYMSLTNSNVRAALGEAVNKMGADIIGINEIDSNFLNDGSYSIKTLSGLSGYTWELDHPDDIDRDGNAIFGYSYSTSCKFADGFAYKNSMFSITDHDWVWISHVADNTYYTSKSSAYGNSGGPETTCAYAKFTHTTSGKQFYVFVTHTSTTDHIGSEVDAPKTDGKYDKENELIVARRARIVNNLKYFCNAKAGSLPYIVMGDFNFGPYYDTKKTRADAAYTSMTSGGLTNAYDEVYAAGNMSDIYISYPGTQTGSNWGAHYMTNMKYPQFRIDHIWLKDGSTQNISAETYKTVRVTYDVTSSVAVLDEETGEPTGATEEVTKTWCPSDHFPVVAQILFE
jgi:hypothetical protein